jgi:hypothetical protein
MALVPITHVYDTLSVINNTGLLDGQILFTTDQPVNKIFADVKVNNILRRIEIGGTNTIDTVLDQTSGHAIANSAVAKLAQTVHTNFIDPTLGTTTVSGVTCTNNGDGTYTLNGTASASTQIILVPYKNYDASDETRLIKHNGKLHFTALPSGAGDSNFYAQVAGATSEGAWKGGGGQDFGDGITFAPTENPFYLYVVRLVIPSGRTFSNLVVKPMLTTDLSATYDDFVQYSGDGELNENVADLYNNLATTNTNLTALDTKVGAQSLLPTPSQSVTQNINTLKAEINQLNSDLLGIVIPVQISNATAFDSKFHVLFDWTSWLNISGMGQYRVIIKLPAPDTRYHKLIVFDNAGSVFICKADATTSYISLVRTI